MPILQWNQLILRQIEKSENNKYTELLVKKCLWLSKDNILYIFLTKVTGLFWQENYTNYYYDTELYKYPEKWENFF